MFQHRLSRRSFLKAAALTTGGFVLTACGAKATTQPEPTVETGGVVEAPTEAPTPYTPSTDANTVDVWVQQFSIDVMKGAAAVFTQKNPDIKINWVPMGLVETSNNLLAAFAAGAGAPDAAFIQWTDIMKFTLRDGVGLRDLTDKMQPKTDWIKWNLDLVTTKSGKLIGLPEDLGMAMMFYRYDVFEAAGLPSDLDSVAKSIATYDDMIATGQKLTSEADKRWMVNTAGDYWGMVQQEGEVRFFDDSGQPVVNSEKFIRAGELAAKIHKAGIDGGARGMDGNAALTSIPGGQALYPCAAWWDQIIQPSAPGTKGLWGVVSLPSNASWNTGGSFFVFPEMSKKLDAAFKVTSYIEASEEGLTEYMKNGKFLPGFSKFYKSSIFTSPDPFYKDQAWLKAFADMADKAAPIHLDLNDPIAGEVLSQTLNSIILEGADPKTALDAANEEIKKRIG